MRDARCSWSLITLMIVMGLKAAADEPPRTLTLPVPPGIEIDAPTWERLTAGYDKEKRGFLELLLSLDTNRIDLAQDSLIDRKSVV